MQKLLFKNLNDFITFTTPFSNFVTIFGFPLALKIFLREREEARERKRVKKKHVLQVLKDELDLIAHWASRDNAGYPEYPPPNKIQEWSNPFRLIFKPESGGLRQITILEGIVEFKDLYKLVLEVNQCIGRMNDLQNQLSSIASSDIMASLKIDKSLSNPNIKLTSNQILLRDKTFTINKVIHCDVIADGYRPGLKKSFHQLEKAIDLELKRIDRFLKVSFVEYLLKIITNFVLIASLVLLLSFLFFISSSLLHFALLILLIIIAVLFFYVSFLKR